MHGKEEIANGRVEGKVAVVTGAARGMGAAHARALAAEGASVVMTDLRADEGSTVAREIGERARFVEHDVSKAAQWARVIAEAEEGFGPVDVLVNNAGVFAFHPLEELAEDEYRRIVDCNQSSVFLGMKAALPSMRRAGGGSIINVSSIAAFTGQPNTLAYSASKWAVRGMTKAAAAELGQFGIRVNSVHPGFIDTPMYDGIGGALDDTLAQLPIPRPGRPEEVAPLIVYLSSDESTYSTGSEFIVDGGLHVT